MAEFLVESYVTSARAADAEVARMTACTQAGAHVRYVRAIYVPEDESCFHVFEGPSHAAVAGVIAGAGLAGCRIVEAIPILLDGRT
jgi:hypothetical protein